MIDALPAIQLRCHSILDAIGNTPLVRLNRIVKDIPAAVYAKIESLNPGLSAKDRIALQMIERAENKGELLPGGTVIESTSGNTGFSVAMVCAVKAYRCILVTTQKISTEKLAALRALGAEVRICPTDVTAEDPRSYYSVAKALNAEIDNSYYINQYYNDGNALSHYQTTGPEIWQQTNGEITHYIAAVGTGGTISGTAQYLKEQNPSVRVIGVDAYGSVLKKYHETGEFDPKEIYPYKLEAVGKNIIPDNVYFDQIDEFVKVTDKAAALQARAVARLEGILVGYSSGAVLQCLEQIKERLTENDTVVILFSDHGGKYFGKIFSDDWMRAQGFAE